MIADTNIEEKLHQKAETFAQMMTAYLPKEQGQQKTIFDALSYSLLAGGKRIRPIILLETYQALKEQEKGGALRASQLDIINENADFSWFKTLDDIVTKFSVALEMIHTYSLVHDDLPAMDNDEYRRGKLTTHAKYGEDMGILAGDALLNGAFELVAEAFANIKDIENSTDAITLYDRVSRAYQMLSSRSGMYGMIGGQVVDVERTGSVLSKEELLFIYELKTGALLEASFLIGAILSGANQEELIRFTKIAKKVGLAFQIQDDILDVTSTMEVLGKPINSDEKNQKTTYVTLYGIEDSKKEVERLSKEAMEELKALKLENSFLTELVSYLVNREK
ncbi:polyprenyl synthetase family protein [Lachnoclostridium phytofermentans]|uniref:Farnesyl diphosphate synthase n=1 Tax=Lachnoclostridium phytofermentans (strain ATCC 700394 / DSM 18823 / ISDg) TaxID=357809 RepID=A9KMB9_LACP7|nr:polyprenyl synthetase family protein [Lachnoclostridium phytofermentans]ABX42873.1 Polyprenyl synthetase [Lachnoclostridium phytofermentans ISDg]